MSAVHARPGEGIYAKIGTASRGVQGGLSSALSLMLCSSLHLHTLEQTLQARMRDCVQS